MSEIEHRKIRRLLVANRSEIAIRVMRAAAELGIGNVAVYSEEDRFALHRFKADQSYRIGEPGKPIAAYLDIDEMLRVAAESGADAVHPGYGFLSENPDFADACRDAGLIFVGPESEVMRSLGNKVSARKLAESAGVPVMPATEPLPRDLDIARAEAAKIGYPLMLKASWGGGGRGMRVIRSEAELAEQFETARREAEAAFGNGEVYLEKLVERARHVEVQILGDRHGTLVHLFERDCSVQRRNQKVIERAPAPYLDDARREELCDYALALARKAGYSIAGTVEFLMDADTGAFYFIEVNPRIQVEHTVTEQVTGIDIVKAQLRMAEGYRIGDPESFVPRQSNIRLSGHALQCRITTEDPENNFVPDYGRIRAYRGATGFGIRLDGGTAYSGALITPFYDSLLEKVTAWAPRRDDAIARMDRALREFRIRGVTTNLLFLEQIINHPSFRAGDYTTRFIDDTPELYLFPERRDRATRLLRFIGDIEVNGNPELAGRKDADERRPAPVPRLPAGAAPDGTVQLLEQLGAEKFAEWMLEQKRVLLTDTTMRDAHQSLFATRMRTIDHLAIAPAYARLLPELFSIECWGGATFDVAMRFLKEDPWTRLREIKQRTPNILLQMLLRASNAVGYTNYPDNVVQFFVKRAAAAGVDVFRVFDSLNWVENMRVAIDAVLESGKLCEGTICYTGDLTDPRPSKYDLDYYVTMARELEAAGAHILGIKDMAGVCKPAAASLLVSTLKKEVGIPIHFHTHDTSGIGAATILAAVEAGCDAVDGSMDAMSGLTSQPNLGSIVEALRHGERDPGLSAENIRTISRYWEGVRRFYAPFESDIRSGTADVYRHAMPGGQYTNLREQARSLGIERRWPDVARHYAEVNEMFGDIVKVTPSSKVVGDMALFMVTSGVTAEDVLDPEKEIAFPESVVQLFRGDLGQPPGGWPPALQAKVLGGEKADTSRPGGHLPAIDLEAARIEAKEKVGRDISDDELASYLMYPKVFVEFAAHQQRYGDVSILPTPVFFSGLEAHEEIGVDIEPGKTLIIRLLATSNADAEGKRRLFFELNGQPRTITIVDASVNATVVSNRKAEEGNPLHVAAPMPGLVVNVAVKAGQAVSRGDPLVALEAMKMETVIRAEHDGTVHAVPVTVGTQVEAHDLLVEYNS
ncbi:MAG: pyruvate carboxylase [Woeseiaceae bacterium]|jgi:pyruvate carboxylase|nr:pyruvate carboxylase [Woeseiaceae bacterium]